MGTNSIRTNLSKDDIISDIKLSLGADISGENVYLIVEGQDDIKFLKPYCSENVCIYESYSGKCGVNYIAGDFFAQNISVIGIRDHDYQTEELPRKIFFYDGCCLEMMIFKNDYVFEKICMEYYSGDEPYAEFRKDILEELKCLSVIRMCNEKEKWGKRVDGIPIEVLQENQSWRLDNAAIIKKLNQMNHDFFNDDVMKKVCEECDREWNDNDYYNNTQGHDFTRLCAAVCNQKGKKKISNDKIESSGRCVFGVSDFEKTRLYSSIKEYEYKYGLNIIAENR